MTDPAALAQAAQGADAIVHLVAILDGERRSSFEAVNAQGPANAVAAAKAAGVRRFLHMSALGVTAEHAPLTGYWGSKWKGVRAVTTSDLRLDGVRAELRVRARRRRLRRVRAPDRGCR